MAREDKKVMPDDQDKMADQDLMACQDQKAFRDLLVQNRKYAQDPQAQQVHRVFLVFVVSPDHQDWTAYRDLQVNQENLVHPDVMDFRERLAPKVIKVTLECLA
jgi:hypothetical protein